MKTPRTGFNRMVIGVTLCAPGTDRCATIRDVMVDTGSTGLRIAASALPSFLQLPPSKGPDGAALAECLRFVHASAWGPLVRADLHLGGLIASDVSMQVMEDGPSQQPKGCPPSYAQPTSNGTIGVGPHLYDCRGDCEQVAESPGLFTMDQGTWIPVHGRVGRPYRVPNPVARLPVHDNGIVIDLPAPRGAGETDVTGTLTLGVGTAENNRLGDARVVRMDRRGYFTTVYNDVTYPESYLDSGTMTYILHDDHLRRCPRLPWAFCLEPRRKLSATMVGGDGSRLPTSFIVGDHPVEGERRSGVDAGAAVASDAGTKAFVWGAPYFLGKRIVIVMEGMGVPGDQDLTGPLFAVEPGTEPSIPAVR